MRNIVLLIIVIGFTTKSKAQFDANNNLQIGYNKKIYSVSAEPYKFEFTPFTNNGNTEFKNYYATGDYKFFVSNGVHGNGNTIGLSINENGNVGIGTTNPSNGKLVV